MDDRRVLEENLKRHLRELAVPRHVIANPEGHERASRYIAHQLQSFGLSVHPHIFSWQKRSFQNWIARSPKQSGASPLLIIAAHFDTVPDCPGADDNASGVAVLLEAARRCAQKPLANQAVEFVAFDLEECDLIGSKAYAAQLKKEGRELLGMVSLEMVGMRKTEEGTQKYPRGLATFYPDRGDFIALVGSSRSLGFFWKVRKAFRKVKTLKSQGLVVPGRGMAVPDVRRSDHAPFWDQGYPAVLVTDTSFFRNPYYHTPQDTMEKLDVAFIAQIVQATEGLITACLGA